MSNSELGDNEFNRVVKEISRTETEIEFARHKIEDAERQAKAFKEDKAEVLKQL